MPRAPLPRALTGRVRYAAAPPPAHAPVQSAQFPSQPARFGPVPARLPHELRHGACARAGARGCLAHAYSSDAGDAAASDNVTSSAADADGSCSNSNTNSNSNSSAAERRWALLAPAMAVPAEAPALRPRRKPAPADCVAAAQHLGDLRTQMARLFVPPPPPDGAARRQRLRELETRGRPHDLLTGLPVPTVAQQTRGPRDAAAEGPLRKGFSSYDYRNTGYVTGAGGGSNGYYTHARPTTAPASAAAVAASVTATGEFRSACEQARVVTLPPLTHGPNSADTASWPSTAAAAAVADAAAVTVAAVAAPAVAAAVVEA